MLACCKFMTFLRAAKSFSSFRPSLVCHLRSVIDFTCCCTVVVFDADVRRKREEFWGSENSRAF